MYSSFLVAHSWLRWVIFISLCMVILRAGYCYFGKKSLSYQKVDNTLFMILLASTHMQVLVGFILYFFLSPVTMLASQNFMKNPVLRYWKIEHLFIMFIFLVLVQLTRVVSKKQQSATKKYKITLFLSLLAFVILMIGIPWPNKEYGRPFFRVPVTMDYESDVNAISNP